MEIVRIGIPRALLFYKQFPYWNSFLQELGAEVIVSDETNKQIISLGVKATSSEVCLPVKVFLGHVLSLSNKCDYIFAPRVVSIEKDCYTCPKLLALPDIIKALPNHPKVLSADFNARIKEKYFFKALTQVAAPLTKNRRLVSKAHKKATQAAENFHKAKAEGKLSIDLLEEIAKTEKKKIRGFKKQGQNSQLKIGIIGHPYNFHDPYISLNFLDRLRQDNVLIQTSENLGHEKIDAQIKTLDKPLYWTYEKEVLGAAMHWLRNKEVDGIIYLLAFACGPDSLIQVIIENESRMYQETSLMTLVIDEHSGEAGFLTRLEAFTDMLRHKKIKEAAAV